MNDAGEIRVHEATGGYMSNCHIIFMLDKHIQDKNYLP